MGSTNLSLVRLLQSKRALAAIGVTVVTLVLIGGVLVATTTIGCGPANALGLHLATCVAANKTAAHVEPAATPYAPPTYYPAKGNIPSPYAFPGSPYGNPASNYPPYGNPVSSYPPYTNPGSGYPPQAGPASGTTDPFYMPASGGPPTRPLSCTLPVYVGPAGSGGFITFPGGSFVADPRSAVALPPPAAGSPSPAPNYPTSGYGPGMGGYGPLAYGMAWDTSHKRWLPVRSEMVAPDGNHYAYPSTNSIYLVDPATNTQTQLGAGHGWIVVRVLNDRVYATVPNTPGFWIVPFSGAPQQVTAKGYWQAASATAAYGMLTSAVPQGVANQIVKLDISTGAISDWFTRDGAQSYVYSFDLQGNPIIYSQYSSAWSMWFTKSATTATQIANSYNQVSFQGPGLADSNGVWFSAYTSVPYGQNGPGFVLWVAGSGFYWMASIGGQLAGGCAA